MPGMTPVSDRLRGAVELAEPGGPDLPDELLQLGERDAVDTSFDHLNVRRLRGVLWALAGVMSIYALVEYSQGGTVLGTLAGLGVVLDLVLVRGLRAGRLQASVRQLAAAVLIGHLLVLQVFHGEAGSGGVGVWFLVFPLLATRFRMAAGETVAMFASLYAVVVLRLVGESIVGKQAPPLLALTVYALAYLALFAFTWGATRRREGQFLSRWRAEAGRHRERLRMKQELEYAREIQLSMLPRTAPSLPWLDVAALSLPATEVGGDYYDYFLLGDERVAVVVGDVTGHGVASGLVLSGVRSSLNLLRDELVAPSRVLDRVNVMLKRTTARRMLMTLGLVVLDHEARGMVVATAGHPPVLVHRAVDGRVVEVGQSAVPLGALAGATYREDRVPLMPGDVVVVYSDGVVETADAAGELFGWQRLSEAIRAGADASRDARGVRDAVLRELWGFKGDAEQVDDVTMVVIRCREG